MQSLQSYLRRLYLSKILYLSSLVCSKGHCYFVALFWGESSTSIGFDVTAKIISQFCATSKKFLPQTALKLPKLSDRRKGHWIKSLCPLFSKILGNLVPPTSMFTFPWHDFQSFLVKCVTTRNWSLSFWRRFRFQSSQQFFFCFIMNNNNSLWFNNVEFLGSMTCNIRLYFRFWRSCYFKDCSLSRKNTKLVSMQRQKNWVWNIRKFVGLLIPNQDFSKEERKIEQSSIKNLLNFLGVDWKQSFLTLLNLLGIQPKSNFSYSIEETWMKDRVSHPLGFPGWACLVT